MMPSEEKTKKRIIECLRKAHPMDLPVNEIAISSGINRNTTSKYLAVLEAHRIVRLTRKIGQAKLYAVTSEASPESQRKKQEASIQPVKKRIIQVEFIKDYLQYRCGEVAQFEEDYAREFIRSGMAKEVMSK